MMYLVVDGPSGATFPVGRFEQIGVLVPGSGRGLAITGGDQASAYPVDHEPDGSSLFTVDADGASYTGKPFHYGGTLRLVASVNSNYAPWSVTIQIATDPLSGHEGHTYVGSGTTVMQVGQTFVIDWPLGADPPTTSDPGVLAPLGDPLEAFVGLQPFGQGNITQGIHYRQQVFAAIGTGDAVIRAPSAFDPVHAYFEAGPSQQFIVQDNPRWTCSPERGCATADATPPNSLPDRYFPAGATPAL